MIKMELELLAITPSKRDGTMDFIEKHRFVLLLLKRGGERWSPWPVSGPYFVEAEKWADTTRERLRLFSLETKHWGKKQLVPRVNMRSHYKDTFREWVIPLEREITHDEVIAACNSVDKNVQVVGLAKEIAEIDNQIELLRERVSAIAKKQLALKHTLVLESLKVKAQ